MIFRDHLRSLHQDAIQWKANRLWNQANDPDEQATAMEQLAAMMVAIPNETKRTTYVDMLERTLKIKQRLLKKEVKTEIDRRAKQMADKKAKAKLAGKIANAEDEGLPSDFKGDIYDALKYGIYEHEGVYFTRGNRGGDYPVTNFTMKILYHIQTADDLAYRMISIKNLYGFEKMLMLNTDDFVSVGSFKKCIARNGDFIFKGGDADLSRLQEMLQKDEVRTVFVKTLGYNKRGQFYAFANGIIPTVGDKELIPVDKYGIVKFNDKNFVIPALSEMYADKDEIYKTEKKFIYTKPQPNFGCLEWCQLYCRAYGEKGRASILFYVGALFGDIIVKHVQRFPILNLFGPPGSGKGEMANSLMAMFGEPQDQIMLGGQSTAVGFMRKFAQLSNAIVFLDEYKNNLKQNFIESLKNIYDRKGYERGKMTNDFSTESTPIYSSCILAGQDMPTIEPALFMRCIMLAFNEGKFSVDQRAAFSELKSREQQGLSYITAQLVGYRSLVEEKFKDRQAIIFKEVMKEAANPEIEDRMILNVSILLAIYDIFRDVLAWPFTYKEVKTWMIENMIHQHLILSSNNDLAKFWGIIESLFHQGTVMEGRDFILQDGYLYLSLERTHGYYIKEMIARRDNNQLSKGTIEHYFGVNTESFIEKTRKRFPDGTNVNAWKFRYNKLGIDLIKISNQAYTEDQKNAELNKKYMEMGVEHDPGAIVAPEIGFRPVVSESDNSPF